MPPPAPGAPPRPSIARGYGQPTSDPLESAELGDTGAPHLASLIPALQHLNLMPSTVASPPMPNPGGGVTEEEGPTHSHLPHTTALSPPHSEGVLSTQASSPPPPCLVQDTDSAHATSPAVQAATSTGATHLAEAHFEPEMAVVLQEVADLLATQEHSHSSGQLPASTSTAFESGGGSPSGPFINDPPVWSVHAAKECARKMRLLGVPERLLGRLLAALTEPNYNIEHLFVFQPPRCRLPSSRRPLWPNRLSSRVIGLTGLLTALSTAGQPKKVRHACPCDLH